MTQPGWYPDPWSPGGRRWWSGRDWPGYTAPGTPSRPPDGFAIASLVTSLVCLSPVGIGSFASSAGTCEGRWGGSASFSDVQIDIKTLLLYDQTASVSGEDDDGERWEFELRRIRDDWRVSEIRWP